MQYMVERELAASGASTGLLLGAQEAAARAQRTAACGALSPSGGCGSCGGGAGRVPEGACARCGAVVVAVVGKGHVKGIALAVAMLAAAAACRGAPAAPVEPEKEVSMPLDSLIPQT